MNTKLTTTFRAVRALTLAAGLVTVLLPTAATAKDSSSGKVDVQLVSTGVDADANSRAKLKVRRSDDARFQLRARGLDVGGTYDLVFDGVSIGSLTADSSGRARARYRSRPRSSSDRLLGFDPRGSVLVVRNALGQDILAGDFPTGTSNASDDSKIVCCVPDDSGTECEDRSADECVAEGGTVSAATTCLPNPCDTTVVPTEDDVVCCLPDDSGPECEDRTIAECSAEGGIVVEADSCLENPCAAIPPLDTDTRCCTADDSGDECEGRLPSECMARGGVDIGSGVCAIDSCDGIAVPTGDEAIRIDCELRSDRSRVSVNGSGLRAGSYTATIVSGANNAVGGPQAAVLGQAEFDFDSDGGDIAAGATAIASNFLTASPSVTAQILDENSNLIAQGTAACRIR